MILVDPRRGIASSYAWRPHQERFARLWLALRLKPILFQHRLGRIRSWLLAAA